MKKTAFTVLAFLVIILTACDNQPSSPHRKPLNGSIEMDTISFDSVWSFVEEHGYDLSYRNFWDDSVTEREFSFQDSSGVAWRILTLRNYPVRRKPGVRSKILIYRYTGDFTRSFDLTSHCCVLDIHDSVHRAPQAVVLFARQYRSNRS